MLKLWLCCRTNSTWNKKINTLFVHWKSNDIDLFTYYFILCIFFLRLFSSSCSLLIFCSVQPFHGAKLFSPLCVLIMQHKCNAIGWTLWVYRWAILILLLYHVSIVTRFVCFHRSSAFHRLVSLVQRSSKCCVYTRASVQFCDMSFFDYMMYAQTFFISPYYEFGWIFDVSSFFFSFLFSLCLYDENHRIVNSMRSISIEKPLH